MDPLAFGMLLLVLGLLGFMVGSLRYQLEQVRGLLLAHLDLHDTRERLYWDELERKGASGKPR